MWCTSCVSLPLVVTVDPLICSSRRMGGVRGDQEAWLVSSTAQRSDLTRLQWETFKLLFLHRLFIRKIKKGMIWSDDLSMLWQKSSTGLKHKFCFLWSSSALLNLKKKTVDHYQILGTGLNKRTCEYFWTGSFIKVPTMTILQGAQT